MANKKKDVEIRDLDKIYEFLSKLIENEKGQLLLDFYSYYSWDEIIKIEKIDGRVFKIYWKNKDFKSHDEEVFADYMYLLVKIDKIMVNKNIYIKANLLKKKDIRRFLELNKDTEIYSDPNLLFSEVTFRDINNKSHSCIISDMPFYSMRISNKGSEFSRYELYYLNMEELIGRFDEVDSWIDENEKNNVDDDRLSEKGNTLRKILERVLKIYIIIKEYNVFNENMNQYDRLTLGSLMILLKENKDSICVSLSDDMRILANKFSHDSGQSYSMTELIEFRDYAGLIIKQIIENIDI